MLTAGTIIAGNGWMVEDDITDEYGWISNEGKVKLTIPTSGWLYFDEDGNCGESDCWFSDPDLKFIKT